MASTENWIRTAKCNENIPVRSDDMDKMPTKFPRSGMQTPFQFFTYNFPKDKNQPS